VLRSGVVFVDTLVVIREADSRRAVAREERDDPEDAPRGRRGDA